MTDEEREQWAELGRAVAELADLLEAKAANLRRTVVDRIFPAANRNELNLVRSIRRAVEAAAKDGMDREFIFEVACLEIHRSTETSG